MRKWSKGFGQHDTSGLYNEFGCHEASRLIGYRILKLKRLKNGIDPRRVMRKRSKEFGQNDKFGLYNEFGCHGASGQHNKY